MNICIHVESIATRQCSVKLDPGMFAHDLNLQIQTTINLILCGTVKKSSDIAFIWLFY